MEDFGEIITVILTCAVAVFGVVLKTKGTKVKRTPPASHSGQESGQPAAVLKDKPLAKPVRPVAFEEGQRMLEQPESAMGEIDKISGKEKKVAVDKKKLIIYSEIMKTKFDD